MANCPNCGSTHIQLRKETNVSWGRAAAGWVFFGAVGGAVGAVTGKDRNVNACLNCGTSWKAADLYKILQTIKTLTGSTLNLSLEHHRLFVNNFMSEFSSHLETISNIEKQTQKIVEDRQNIVSANAAGGCGYGCLTSFVGCTFMIGSVSSGGIPVILLISPLVGLGIGMLIGFLKKQFVEQEIETTKGEANRKKLEEERKIKFKLNVFMESHPL